MACRVYMEHAAHNEGLKCDFCSSAKIEWRYPATSFNLPEFKYGSVTDWAACDECAALIEGGPGARAKLLERSVDSLFARNPLLKGQISKRQAREQIRTLHEKFFTHRAGNVIADRVKVGDRT